MFTIELNERQRDALVAVLNTLERKAAKGEWWRVKMQPIMGLAFKLQGMVAR